MVYSAEELRPGRGAHPLAKRRVPGEPQEPLGQGVGIPHVRQIARGAVVDDRRNPPPPRRDDRQTQRHRFQEDQSEGLGLEEGWEAKHVGPGVGGQLRSAGQDAGER